MGNLVQLPQTNIDYMPKAQQVAVFTGRILTVSDTPGATSLVTYATLDGTKPSLIAVSSPASTITAAMNAGNEGVSGISVTVINDQTNTSTVRTINCRDIDRVVVDRLNESRSYVLLTSPVQDHLITLHCEETMAEIITASNA